MSFLKTIAAVAGTLIAVSAMAQTPVGTAFTYQGALKVSGQPGTQPADFRFRLYDAAAAGNQVGTQVVAAAVTLTSGLFTVPLDFGAAAFGDNTARWLEIDVRSPAGTGTYTTLATRQALTAAPFSLATRGIAVDSTGAVGIGTSAPTNRLTVAGNGDNNCTVAITSGATASQASTLRFNDQGTPVWSITKFANNDFAIREAGPSADRLYIAQGGNVGIGSTSPANRLSVNGSANFSGNVGIGTSNPQVKLDIQGGGWTASNSGGAPRMECTLDSTGGNPAYLYSYNGVSQPVTYVGVSGSLPTGGLMGVLNPAANTVLRAGVSWNGNAGLMFADLKQFRMLNPRQPGTDIAYACIEGPEAAAYVRGTGHLVNGRAVVMLPVHFQDVATADGMTVEVTPCSAASMGLAVTFEATDHFEVAELLNGAGTYDFHWRVEAVRQGYEDYQVIRPTSERMPGAAAGIRGK